MPTELDYLIEEISEKEKVAIERGWDEKTAKIETDRAKAEEARKKAMERLGETRRRQREEQEDETSNDGSRKRSRGSGTETIAYL